MNPKVKLGLSAMSAAAAFYGVNSPMLFGIRLGVPPQLFVFVAGILFLFSVFIVAYVLGFAVEAIRDIWNARAADSQRSEK